MTVRTVLSLNTGNSGLNFLTALLLPFSAAYFPMVYYSRKLVTAKISTPKVTLKTNMSFLRKLQKAKEKTNVVNKRRRKKTREYFLNKPSFSGIATNEVEQFVKYHGGVIREKFESLKIRTSKNSIVK